MLYLFLIVIRWREYLSSGENRAGWADLVGKPLGSTFYIFKWFSKKGKLFQVEFYLPWECKHVHPGHLNNTSNTFSIDWFKKREREIKK